MSVKKEADALIEAKYSKKQLESASRYQEKRDLLAALLAEGKKYTFQEADEMINHYMKGTVK